MVVIRSGTVGNGLTNTLKLSYISIRIKGIGKNGVAKFCFSKQAHNMLTAIVDTKNVSDKHFCFLLVQFTS